MTMGAMVAFPASLLAHLRRAEASQHLDPSFIVSVQEAFPTVTACKLPCQCPLSHFMVQLSVQADFIIHETEWDLGPLLCEGQGHASVRMQCKANSKVSKSFLDTRRMTVQQFCSCSDLLYQFVVWHARMTSLLI